MKKRKIETSLLEDDELIHVSDRRDVETPGDMCRCGHPRRQHLAPNDTCAQCKCSEFMEA